MPIETVQVVYLIGPSGTGKSFSGDYLQVVHGYKHVDGDGPAKNCAVKPEYREMTKNLFCVFAASINPTKELWGAYFEELAKQTVNAAKENDRVVLTHATQLQEPRDFVIEKIAEGGVPRNHITVIELTIDTEVRLRHLYHRTKRQYEKAGITIEEWFKTYSPKWEGDELTEEKFINIMKKAEGKKKFEDCPMAIKVDVTGRDITHCDNIDKALGLTRSSDWTYEIICEKVLPLDKARDAEFAANGSADVLGELVALATSNPAIKDDDKDTEEVKELKKKRRSTLIESNSWKDMDFDKIDLETDE